MSSSDPQFSDFTFTELLNFVSTISRTKKQSSLGVWKDGHGLESMDNLEANVDQILEELTTRVKKVWSLDRIQSNFARAGLNLPNEILNIFNITSSELNRLLYKFPPAIGAENVNGVDEIWLVINNMKYLMKSDGKIFVSEMPRKEFFS
ncbi:hypothetical protein [Candidatus Lokiarchaeum ossiferum]|uniref:hypothetical protein n=1 Tax=Candidatus Lokiarchaeum ossiferum TaxID=2951803 RepID=UPI00352D7106